MASLKMYPEENLNVKQLTIQQFSMKHGHSRHTSDELEVGEVVLIT